MSAGVAVGYGVDVVSLNLSRFFKERAGHGGSGEDDDPRYDPTHDSYTPIIASADALQASSAFSVLEAIPAWVLL